MKDVLGSYGSIYRTGGDEFAAIITVPGSERAALIGRLRDSFEKPKRGCTHKRATIICRKEMTGAEALAQNHGDML